MRFDVAHRERVLKAFSEATREAIGTMADQDVAVEGVDSGRPIKRSVEISAQVSLSGNPSGDGLVIAMPLALARTLVASMLGMEVGQLAEEDVFDGCGELANLVAGGAKTHLADSEHEFELGTPSVAIGDSSSCSTTPEGDVTVIHCRACDMEFTVAYRLCER